MSHIQVCQEFVANGKSLESLCPFGAIVSENDRVSITDSCRMCLICVKKGPPGVFTLQDDPHPVKVLDKALYRGILVCAECHHGHIHPVSLELVGKARQLAAKIAHPVYACVIGHDITDAANTLVAYGVDTVFQYDDEKFKFFKLEHHAAVLEDTINALTPSVVLVGGTSIGRTLAPRVAARLRTGLTADCTSLDIQENTDLDQIRPAFGGNIMAHIRTVNHRPQFATVRYKIFETPLKVPDPMGTVVMRAIPAGMTQSKIEILGIRDKGVGSYIEEADVVIAVGKGIQKRSNVAMFERLAELLGGQVACTRPLVEIGWVESRRQIGLSGRTVRPKLIITCGISGSVQFSAGMKGSERIISINNDPNAQIFRIAHIGIVGDVFEIIPRLIEKIEQDRRA